MNNAPQTATRLIELLANQHQTRSPHLFKQGTFTLAWRAKVGSFPFPDLETIVSAAEPCGRFDWRSQNNADQFHYDQNLPADEKREPAPAYFDALSTLSKNQKSLPLNGYIPGSALRGIVRAWAMRQSANDRQAVKRLLGDQEGKNDITPGKIEFLDAWPTQPSPLAIDVVNPQEDFQIYHDNSKQPAPHTLYTLGDGRSPVTFNVAIRGIAGKASAQDVTQVWQWLEQALAAQGLGSRTASGYGMVESAHSAPSAADPSHAVQRFHFTLYSQGVEGPIQGTAQKELRPSHWRGWLRSWTLRFLLCVMSERNAKILVEELFGTLESTHDNKHRQGCVRVQLLPKQSDLPWGELSKQSNDRPDFYIWKGQVQISAPADILALILLPIIKVAASVGGIGRGWRRPLHFFVKKSPNSDRSLKFARGAHLLLTAVGDPHPYQLSPTGEQWTALYTDWVQAVRAKWGDRGTPNSLNAEVFSPATCAVYAVPGPTENPIDVNGTSFSLGAQKASSSVALARGAKPGQKKPELSSNNDPQRSPTVQWATTASMATRGRGMDLIYQTTDSQPPRNYKGNPEVGGRAAGGGSKSSFCSWVSIRRIDEPHPTAGTDCQEVVCLFLGAQTQQGFQRDRYQFLRDLGKMEDSHSLFGVRP